MSALSPVLSQPRVLHLTHTYIPKDSRILKQITCLSQKYSVFAIGIGDDDFSPNIPFLSNLRVISLPLLSRNLLSIPRTFRHFLSLLELTYRMLPLALKCKPSVVHCHDTIVLPLGLIVKLLTRSKLIYDAHELESNRNGLNRTQSYLTLLVERFAWNFIDHLVVVSPSIRDWYLRFLGHKSASVILNSPLLIKTTEVNNHYFRQLYSIPSDSKIFLYIGMFSPGRGLDLIIEAFKEYNLSSHLVLLGFGSLKSNLESISTQYSNIHIHEPVPHHDVVSLAQSADYGLCLIQNVSLSDYYSLPNKIFEYCFAGIPVLASKFPDIQNLVDHYNLGSCCDLSVDSIVSAISKLESDPDTPSFEDLSPLAWDAQELILRNIYCKLLFNL